jgi:predicted amidohydrolase
MKSIRDSLLAWFIACTALLAGAAPDSAASAATRVRVAAISFVPVKLALEQNADRLEKLIREAAAGGARLIVAPEGALDGYAINQVLARQVSVERLREAAISIEHPVIQRFQTLAKSIEACLVFGFSEKIGDELYNTAVFIDHAGVIRGKYHKMQFAEGYHPSWWFNRLGGQSRAFDTPFGRCGILICNDRWNPELAKIPALDGAQFLIIPSYGSSSAAQDEAVIGRARETGLPIVEANVGVSLIVSGGQPVATRRAPESVTFGEISIPPAAKIQTAARDEAERTFLEWRGEEMQRRYAEKQHRLQPAVER